MTEDEISKIIIGESTPSIFEKSQKTVQLHSDNHQSYQENEITGLQLSSRYSNVKFSDWRGIYTTPVKDQGACGSCWAHSGIEQIESDAIRTLGKSYGYTNTSEFSVQELVDCDTQSIGCSGGRAEAAYISIMNRIGGVGYARDYPYTAKESGVCKTDTSRFAVGLSGYTIIDGESSMKDYVLSTGPLAVALCASTFYYYTGGVLTSTCSTINHAVQLVGINLNDPDLPYWIVS